MAVASPYAVFTAAELGWPPLGLAAPLRATPSKSQSPPTDSRRPKRNWSEAIQGTLFELA